MAWDVFLSERLELRRGLGTDEIRNALARGELRDDDLVRPAGSSEPWTPLADLPALGDAASGLEPAKAPSASFVVPVADPPPAVGGDDDEVHDGKGTDEDAKAITIGWNGDDDERAEDDDSGSFDQIAGAFTPVRDDREDEPAPASVAQPALEDDDADEGAAAHLGSSPDDRSGAGAAGVHAPIPAEPLGRYDLDLEREESPIHVGLPVERPTTAWSEPEPVEDLGFEPEEIDPLEEDEEAAEFTLSRGGPEKVEELDLAAMVDVAFQLVLFFLVTATTVLYKTLEVPRPNPEQAPAAAQAQSDQPRTLEDLEADFILVNIDPQGAFTIDREPVDATVNAVVERLRKARTDTGRTAMLLTADAAAMHRLAVVAYDAANEIGLRIAIARPPARRPEGPQPPPAAKNL
jgi:biopolymer transport protein ExbD